MNRLKTALNHELYLSHSIGDKYTMEGDKNEWTLFYYPIFENGKTKEIYDEPRALIERRQIFNNIKGFDFREVPLRYLNRVKTK